ncbi:hypothetical protein AB205_0009340 [Aquarana catesbeiana]|uniref:Peptidase C13 family protein n=1 Tax=Aquarana catesbeiana TaxID=8400 RepID=A0A2G9S0E1_AQUCT|nr:hypothetical protein AB205_0009340 [Aquarana catesbeiana]
MLIGRSMLAVPTSLTQILSLTVLTTSMPINDPEDGGSTGWSWWPTPMAVTMTDIRLTCATLIKLSSRTASLKELNKTIQYMYDKKMVLYIEACESGSMMNRLSNNINVFPTTAANPTKFAYACYGKARDILWRSLQYQMDGGLSDGETVQGDSTQFILVKQHTNTRYVMQYGN